MRYCRIIFLAVVASCALSSCFTLKPPMYKRIENLSVVRNDSVQTAAFDVVFQNPNSFGCSVSKMEADGDLMGRNLFKASAPQTIRAKRKTDFQVPVQATLQPFDMSQVLQGLDAFLNNQSLTLHLKGKITLRKFLIRKTYFFDHDEHVDKSQLIRMF